MRPKRAGNKFERADFVTERADVLLERADSESERARLGPVRPGGCIILERISSGTFTFISQIRII